MTDAKTVPSSRCGRKGTSAYVGREFCERLHVLLARRIAAGQRHLKFQHLVDEAIEDLLTREDAHAE
jgi:hypothetical protein